MSIKSRFASPLTALQLGAFLVLGVLLARWVTSDATASGVESDLVVRDARTCAALTVYEHSARNDDYAFLATIARTQLNQYAVGPIPDCAAGLTDALADDFSPRRWQTALDVVDVVQSGDYTVSPDACAQADRIVPLDPSGPTPPTPAPEAAAAWTQCVIFDLAFVGGAR